MAKKKKDVYPDSRLRQSESARLTDYTRSRARQITGMVVTVILNSAAWLLMLSMWKQGEPAGIAFGIGFIIVAGLVGLWCFWGILAGMKIGTALMQVSTDMPYLGEEFKFAYAQKMKSNCVVDGVVLTLICEEIASYQVGTNRVTVRHKAVEAQMELVERQNVNAGEPLRGEGSFTVPGHCMHTFKGGYNNKIDWRLELKVRIDSWPDYSAKFHLNVPPLRLPGTQSSMDLQEIIQGENGPENTTDPQDN